MIVLVPEINLINYPFFLLVSLFYKVKTCEFYPGFLVKLKGGIDIVNAADYFDWEDLLLVRSDAVSCGESILDNMQEEKWIYTVHGRRIDFSLKAKQMLQRDIEDLCILGSILKKNEKGSIIIAESVKYRHLRKMSGKNRLFNYKTAPVISAINIFLGYARLKAMNFYRYIKLVQQLLYGFIFNKGAIKGLKYVYDGISTRELDVGDKKITFTWFADGEDIKKEEVFYNLPEADFQMKKQENAYKTEEGLLANLDMHKDVHSSRKKIVKCFLESTLLFLKNALFEFSFEKIVMGEYAVLTMRWIPFIETMKPRIYLESVNSMSVEDPAVLYFREAGIKTVMWLYSCNSYLFLTHNKRGVPRKKLSNVFGDIYQCYIMADTLIVWNEHFQRFIKKHPHRCSNIKVMGPIMHGDENVMHMQREELFKLYGIEYKKGKYIAFFDMPPVSKEYVKRSIQSTKNTAQVLNYYTEEYNEAFMKDALRLLREHDDIRIIYKPKRSLTSGKFGYGDGTRIIRLLEQDPRVIIMDYNVNPWVPIAMSDVSVSMAFGAPAIASLHYGRLGLFHDPVNIVNFHRYDGIPQIITHNYDELKSKVNTYLSEGTIESKKLEDIDLSDYIGSEPGKDANKQFRTFIKDIY